MQTEGKMQTADYIIYGYIGTKENTEHASYSL